MRSKFIAHREFNNTSLQEKFEEKKGKMSEYIYSISLKVEAELSGGHPGRGGTRSGDPPITSDLQRCNIHLLKAFPVQDRLISMKTS